MASLSRTFSDQGQVGGSVEARRAAAAMTRSCMQVHGQSAGEMLRNWRTSTTIFHDAVHNAWAAQKSLSENTCGPVRTGQILELFDDEAFRLTKNAPAYQMLLQMDKVFGEFFTQADVITRMAVPLASKDIAEPLKQANETLQYHYRQWRKAYLSAACSYDDILEFYDMVQRAEDEEGFGDPAKPAEGSRLLRTVMQKRVELYERLVGQARLCDNRRVDLDEGLSVLRASLNKVACALEEAHVCDKTCSAVETPARGEKKRGGYRQSLPEHRV